MQPDGSSNFITANNQAHLFIKLHLWQEDNTLTSLTIVDMAGYPSHDKMSNTANPGDAGTAKSFIHNYKEGHSEINANGVNYLMYVFKDMLFQGNRGFKQ